MLRYWRVKEGLNYPNAKQMVKEWQQEIERQEEAQQQALAAQAEMTVSPELGAGTQPTAPPNGGLPNGGQQPTAAIQNGEPAPDMMTEEQMQAMLAMEQGVLTAQAQQVGAMGIPGGLPGPERMGMEASVLPEAGKEEEIREILEQLGTFEPEAAMQIIANMPIEETEKELLMEIVQQGMEK